MVMTKTASRPNGAREPLVQAADTCPRCHREHHPATAGAAATAGRRGRGPKPRLGMALGSLPEDLTSLVSLYQGFERQEVVRRRRSAAERMLALAESDSVESASRGAAGRRGERMGGRERAVVRAERVGQSAVGRVRSAADDRDRRGFPGRSHAGPSGATFDHRGRQVGQSEVNGTKSGAPQAAMVKSIEATVYIDRIRELAGGITTSRPGRGRGPKPRLGMALGSLGALPEDLTSLASLYQGPERQEVATRCRSAAERILALPEKLDPRRSPGSYPRMCLRLAGQWRVPWLRGRNAGAAAVGTAAARHPPDRGGPGTTTLQPGTERAGAAVDRAAGDRSRDCRRRPSCARR